MLYDYSTLPRKDLINKRIGFLLASFHHPGYRSFAIEFTVSYEFVRPIPLAQVVENDASAQDDRC